MQPPVDHVLVRTTKPKAAAAVRIGAGLGQQKRVELAGLLQVCFARVEPWLQARKYVSAVASGLARRNGWTIAEQAGDRSPDKTQRLLNRAVWDTWGAMGVVRRFAVAGLDEAAARSGRRRALVIGGLDETGQCQPGQATAGGKRQYLGGPGRGGAKHRRRWEIRSAGAGYKGKRWYAWAWLDTASPAHHLLIRRHLKTGELAFHYCFVPKGQRASMARLIRAAGLRWPVEEDFEFGKDCFGLDQSQVRLYTAIAPHTLLVMPTSPAF